MMTKAERQVSRGFTLIEMVTVVAVIGILAAIAYPSYMDSILKGRRAQARTALLDLMQQQERYMTQRNVYMQFTNIGGTTVPANASSTFKVFSGDNNSSTAYWLSADLCSGTPSISECVKVIATPIANDAAVASLSLTSTGVKDCTGTAKSANFKLCWP
jgi:type IV pilus assembly protein PilE